MLKRPPDEADAENLEARQQYEIMQCFTVSQPLPVQEDGDGSSSVRPSSAVKLSQIKQNKVLSDCDFLNSRNADYLRNESN